MEFEKSSIERLKRSLYSRDENLVPKEKRTPVASKESETPVDWGTRPTFDISPEAMTKKNNSFFNKFLVGSLIFFFIALGIAGFIFSGGLNMISSNNLDMKIIAPSSISSGEELSVGFSVVNGNRADLEDVTLFIDYPDGSQSVGDLGKVLTYESIPLGTIAKGSIKDYTTRLLLFGEKDSEKKFNFRLEYKVKGSNAIFSKEKIYTVLVGSSPLLLNVDYPKEVNSGREMTLTLEITSNSGVVIKNSLIRVDYPYGFTYKSANINPTRDNFVWNIGDLKNGDKKTLIIKGVLVGQDQEDRSFRISAGSQTSATVSDFDTTLAATTVTVGIRKSFFDLSVTSGTFGEPTAGRSIPVVIKWQNTLPDKIINSQIEAVVSGTGLDRTSVSVANGGFYRSVDNMVLWDKNGTPNLTSILPGEDGQVSFLVSSIDPAQIRTIKNPHIDISVTMKGDRSGLDVVGISSSKDYTIKIPSTMSILAKSTRIGPFQNTGPIPPHADVESTYGITWTLTNTTNDLKDTVVTATLPSGVSWKGESKPGTERISYDPDTRVVTWTVGNVLSGAGFSTSPKEVSFKVGIIPSVNQIGSNPSLISITRVFANDTYAETAVSATAPTITTLFSDSSYRQGDETILK